MIQKVNLQFILLIQVMLFQQNLSLLSQNNLQIKLFIHTLIQLFKKRQLSSGNIVTLLLYRNLTLLVKGSTIYLDRLK
jgi:hypothetical protein